MANDTIAALNTPVDIETDEQFSDAELAALANFGPEIDETIVDALEEAASGESRGRQRRVVLLSMMRGADDLSGLSLREPVAYGEMLGAAESFLEHARGLVAVAQSAVLRLKVADCREAR